MDEATAVDGRKATIGSSRVGVRNGVRDATVPKARLNVNAAVDVDPHGLVGREAIDHLQHAVASASAADDLHCHV